MIIKDIFEVNISFHEASGVLKLYSTNAPPLCFFQRPSLLYTPPDLGSPAQQSPADVAVGTLISFSP